MQLKRFKVENALITIYISILEFRYLVNLFNPLTIYLIDRIGKRKQKPNKGSNIIKRDTEEYNRWRNAEAESHKGIQTQGCGLVVDEYGTMGN